MKPDLTERLLRGLYSLALYALLPVTIYHLVWRGFRHPAYLSRWLAPPALPPPVALASAGGPSS